jgi:hypothetical protein
VPEENSDSHAKKADPCVFVVHASKTDVVVGTSHHALGHNISYHGITQQRSDGSVMATTATSFVRYCLWRDNKCGC